MTLNIEQLLCLADRLDREGQYSEADKIGEMVKKLVINAEEGTDDEFKKQLMEEGWKDPQVQVGFPEEVEQDEMVSLPEPETKEILDEELKSKLSQLVEQKWDIFAPGELEQWLAEKGYVSKWKHTGEELQKQELEKSELQGEVLPGVPVPNESEQSDDDGSFPGIMDLESKERIQPEEVQVEEKKNEIRQIVDAFLSNPSAESNENLQSKIIQYVDLASSKQPSKISDEDIASEISRIEQEKGVKWAERNKVFEKLADMADRLDAIGAIEEAGLIDGFIQKHAEADDVLDYQGEDKNSEQSKRYDSKYHHSLQIREPKTKQERVDREGRDKHHIDTMQNVEASALSTRYCPEHVGVMTGRVGENTYQCPIDGATFNSETGWTDHDGNEHPGGSIAGQTPDSSGYEIPHRIFDSRENTLNRVN